MWTWIVFHKIKFMIKKNIFNLMHLKLFMMWKNIFGVFLNMFQGVNTIFWFMKIVQRIRTWKVATINYRFWDIRNLILLLYKTLSTREEYAHLQGQKLPFISMIMCLIPFQSILFIAQYMGVVARVYIVRLNVSLFTLLQYILST